MPAVSRIRDVVRTLVPRKYIEGMKGQVLTTVAPGRTTAPELPLHLPDSDHEAFYRAKAVVDFSKAARVIGYAPAFSFEKGMSRVAEWAAWANLL